MVEGCLRLIGEPFYNRDELANQFRVVKIINRELLRKLFNEFSYFGRSGVFQGVPIICCSVVTYDVFPVVTPATLFSSLVS